MYKVNMELFWDFLVLLGVANRLRFMLQRKKRQRLVDTYGYYKTAETSTGIVIIPNSPLGSVDFHTARTTDFYQHTRIDCPFLLSPRSKGDREYDCQLLTDSISYTTELPNEYKCECIKWTYINSE